MSEIVQELQERIAVADRVAQIGRAPHVSVQLSFELAEQLLALLTRTADAEQQRDALLRALNEAAQTARNYYMLFHDETWKERLRKLDAVIAKAEGR